MMDYMMTNSNILIEENVEKNNKLSICKSKSDGVSIKKGDTMVVKSHHILRMFTGGKTEKYTKEPLILGKIKNV